MKILRLTIPVIVIGVLFFSMPLHAGDQAPNNQGQKDECLLILKNCEMQAESLQQKINRLNEEIAKGTRVYSPDELKKLKEKLQDANRTLELLLNDKQTLGM